jgi:hypothetical protein
MRPQEVKEVCGGGLQQGSDQRAADRDGVGLAILPESAVADDSYVMAGRPGTPAYCVLMLVSPAGECSIRIRSGSW